MIRISRLTLCLSVIAAIRVPSARAADRILRTEIAVPAPVEDVWAAWATEAGVKSFFAKGCHIEPRVDGAYEIFFDPDADPGRRGADGMRILAFEPPRRLSFTWNAPFDQPYARGQRTVVSIQLEPLDNRRTRLRFTHSGWGDGPEWDAAYAYFDRAWNSFALPRLVHRFTKGPIDWKNPPQVESVAASLRTELIEVKKETSALHPDSGGAALDGKRRAFVRAQTGGAQEALALLRSLAGRWVGVASAHRRVRSGYEVVAGGSAVLERLVDEGESESEMTTLYHVDGNRLLATHFCSAGNQPRLVASGVEDGVIRFRFLDITNLASRQAGHVSGLTLHLREEGHLRAEWTWSEPGKPPATDVHRYERAQ